MFDLLFALLLAAAAVVALLIGVAALHLRRRRAVTPVPDPITDRIPLVRDDPDDLEALMQVVRERGEPDLPRFDADEWTRGIYAQPARSYSARPALPAPRPAPRRTSRYAQPVDDVTTALHAVNTAALHAVNPASVDTTGGCQ